MSTAILEAPSVSTDTKLPSRPWLFQPGQRANPHGRPKGSRDFTIELMRGLRVVEKEERKSMIEHAWRRAFVNDKVMMGMLKKIVPDLVHNTGDGTKVLSITYNDGRSIVSTVRPAPADGRGVPAVTDTTARA